ncbi:histidine phosphatase family protein [Nakamurella leprariae]|uniref:Histidine phosphatase family protein n=1 Tax=Nakamurella leprariae TaxID=2803911 RepID=A0A938Y7Q1_9ACTN|nr:histidine phosphatase family protein [Nakamurella leprariae]MBM9467355.1 histidine phosphatase family protein [Nakamurella leprariae]
MTLEHLIVLRHGETDWNRARRMQGHRDVPLNELGRRQAAEAAPSVAALQPELIVSSDLSRARETAEVVAARCRLPLATDARLRETSLGDWEGLTRADVEAGWPGEWAAWRTSSSRLAPPGGESRWQVAQRARAVVDELDAGTTARRALLVAHGGLIVGLTGELLQLPEEAWSTLIGVGNCHWVGLHRVDGPVPGAPWRLHAYNAGLGGVVLPSGEDEVAGV